MHCLSCIGFNCIFTALGKGSKITDEKAGLHKVQYHKIDRIKVVSYAIT